MRYGAVAEFVDVAGSLYSSNGFTLQAVVDLDNGLIARDTDYWDSRELGASDIVGPAAATGAALPIGPVHPGGAPLYSAVPAPPGMIDLARGVTGRPSASPDMLQFAVAFHDALRNGSVRDVLDFFTEDALYVNPLLHQGPVLYPNYNQTIQVRGRRLIGRLLSATLDALPDCRNSRLAHVVGGSSGGGFEWQAGGPYNGTGINRDGLVGCTALDLFAGRIQRMSVKFDTVQMPSDSYEAIRSALRQADVVDQ